MATLVVYEIVCVALFYTCFCRSVRTDKDTITGVRLAFWGVASVTLFCAWLPTTGFFVVNWVDIAMPAAMLVVQLATAKHWRHGVPSAFQRCQCPSTSD